jgi:hypothetical protein
MCGDDWSCPCNALRRSFDVTGTEALIAEDAQRPLGFSRLMRADQLRRDLTPGGQPARRHGAIHNERPSLTAAVMSDTNNMEESNVRQLARPA